MDIAKTVFEAIDKAFYKKQNESFVFDGADNVSIDKNIVYSDIDKSICLLDCYYTPKRKNKKYPVILYIHGGGFVAGDKDHRTGICSWLASNGYFVVNVNYGLSPECHFPEPIYHLVDSVNWIYKNAKQRELNLTKLIVSGDSAGAYYASMLATICLSSELQSILNVKPLTKFGACVLNCGIYNLNKALEEKMLFRINIKVFESYFGINLKEFDSFKLKDYCSPLPFMNKKFPPTFLIYAKKDIICIGQSEFIIDKLNELDIYYESYNSTSLLKNHCFSLEYSSKEAKEANRLMLDFLMRFTQNKLPKQQSKSDIMIRVEEK